MATKFVRSWDIIYSLDIIIIGMLLLIALSGCGSKDNGSVNIQPSSTVQPTATYTPLPTNTSTPEPTKTSIPPTPTLGLGIGSAIIGKDGMILLYVPEGEFIMGSTDADPHASKDEKPQHYVMLNAFWIDQTEVTNAMYAKCVSAGLCKEPTSKESNTHSSYYGNAEFDSYPVIYVDWNMAKTYCEWADRRLPTEAEWEKAARGTEANIYPWGDEAPNNNLLNYNNAVDDTTEVGKYPDGKSIYGALDMAGNVWEWVNDWYWTNQWYGGTYYQIAPTSNPLGPDSGIQRVLRGGSWFLYDGEVRSAMRGFSPPLSSAADGIGFRCAMSATP